MSKETNGRRKGRTPEEVAFGNEVVNNLRDVLAAEEATARRQQEIAEGRAHAEAHPEEFSFFRDANQVANDLKGKVLRTDDGVEVRFLTVEPFPKDKIAMPQIFRQAMDAMPGTITAVNNRGHRYPNITVAGEGLVLPRSFEVSRNGQPSELLLRPVDLAKSLGLEMGETRAIRVVDSVSGEMRLDPRQEPQVPQK